MRYIITEDQYERLAQEEKILELPSLAYFNNDWNFLQEYLKRKGNPKYSIMGDLELGGTSIESLGNLSSVGGDLDLRNTPISKKYSEKEIRNMVKVDENIYLN